MLKFLKATKIHINERFALIDREKIADKPHVLGGLYFSANSFSNFRILSNDTFLSIIFER